MSLIKFNNYRWTFDDFFNNGLSSLDNKMKTDIKETDNEYEFQIELPGYNKEDIKVSFEEDYLIIKAKREKTEEVNNDKYIKRERTYGEYSRSFYIGDIDHSKLTGNYVDGILKVIVPKEEVKKAEEKKYISID